MENGMTLERVHNTEPDFNIRLSWNSAMELYACIDGSVNTTGEMVKRWLATELHG